MLFRLRRKIYRKVFRWARCNAKPPAGKRKLSVRLCIGLGMIGGSFVIGWGGPAVFGTLAIADPSSARLYLVIGGICYVSSWIVWGLGMLLMGRINYMYSKYFLAKFLLKRYGSEKAVSGNG